MKKLYGCSSVRASFLVVGHTKFSPDRWFGLVKRRLKHVDINTVFDVEEQVFNIAVRNDARALGKEGDACVTILSHCPFSENPLFDTFYFDKLVSKECHKLSGHSLWYDVKFTGEGCIHARSSPCGDYPDTVGHSWERFDFIKNPTVVREQDLKDLGRALEEEMPQDCQRYLYEKIRKFVSLGERNYPLHPEYGAICYRTFTCPSGSKDDKVTQEEERMFLEGRSKSPTITKTSIQKMNKDALVQAII